MGSAKALVVRPIGAKEASALVRAVHYSGKVTQNSQMHMGVFWNGRLEGAMQFGPPLDKRKIGGLVSGSQWHNFIELNRMAFSEALPRNSESRALGVAFRLLRKHAPQLAWVVSFSDATQCGDGTIYRASGFVLTGLKKNKQMLRMPDGSVVAKKTLDNPNHTGEGGRFGSRVAIDAGATPLPGYQLRYIRFLDPAWRSRLTVPEIAFSDIPAAARMYRGEMRRPEGGPGVHPGKDGASPIPPLHPTTSPDDG